jgi:phosphoenolpyruvate synthase/pyruvate phosphate dikinase
MNAATNATRLQVPRMSREEFLQRALDAVAKIGYAKLRIHELVKQLWVTRGSFYWHFKDRDNFVRALVDHCHQWSTDRVIVKIGIEKGRATRPDLKIGICGEHGGEPNSVEFCHLVGMNYVSCSPYRVPIARLAAAHAQINHPRD